VGPAPGGHDVGVAGNRGLAPLREPTGYHHCRELDDVVACLLSGTLAGSANRKRQMNAMTRTAIVNRFHDERTARLSELHVALEDGFSGDDVIVRVGGEKAFEAEALRTRLQVGLAGQFTVEVADGDVEVTVEVPGRRITHCQQVTVDGPTWVGISLGERDDVTARISPEPFGYV